MELLLWRWSTLVQATSDLMIAVFFVALAHSVGRIEMRAWVNAWLANLAALLVTIMFWLLQPQARLTFAITISLYVFAKTLFVVLIVDGATRFSARKYAFPSYGRLASGVAVFAIVCGYAIGSIDQLGLVQEVVICLGLGACAVFLLASKTPAYGWLATGFVLRAALAAVESVAYTVHWSTGAAAGSTMLATFLASHSSFDTGAEWVIALGCVLTLYGTIQKELTASNHELVSAKEALQTLLDRDQLTGVFNRRSLPTILHEAQASGATILFFDLDDFKQVNDVHGHHAGDACLVRFARALQESFAIGDYVIRYAGDEFVVVARDLESASIAASVEAVRMQLQLPSASAQRIHFSVGIAQLPAHGDPEIALRAADEAMYREKAKRAA
jgi:diguanylate cyclase (GGDEF)-like protein